MKLDRRTVRATICLSGAVAISVTIVALRQEGGTTPAAWAAIAAALAVLAALVSAWTSQRVVELQEDALQPHIEPHLDARSRYQLVQFRLTNRGQSSALNVQLTWDGQVLCRVGGEPVTLGTEPIPVIGPGESASVALGVSFDFFSQNPTSTFSGIVTFENILGERFRQRFVISAEHERVALMHDHEDPKTQYELQKLPERLEAIASEIEQLRKVLQNTDKGS